MSILSRMPAKIIAYCMECFGPMAHGHYADRKGPIMEAIGGNRYDAHHHPSEHSIVVIVTYGDQERSIVEQRVRMAQEEFSKAQSTLFDRKKFLAEAQMVSEREAGEEQERARLAIPILREKMEAAEIESERIELILKENLNRLENWKCMEVQKVTADMMRADFFDVRASLEFDEPSDESLELSFERIEKFLLEQDQTNKSRVSHIIAKLIEGRKNANQGSSMSDVPPAGGVDRGGDDRAGAGTEGVPAVPRSAAKASKPRKPKANAGK